MTKRLHAALATPVDPAKTLAARTASAMQHLQQGLQLNQVRPQDSTDTIACIMDTTDYMMCIGREPLIMGPEGKV